MDYDRYASAVRAEYAAFVSHITAEYLARGASGQGVEAVSELRIAGLKRVSALMTHVLALTNDYLAPTGNGTLHDPRDNTWLSELRQIAVKNLNDLIARMMGGAGRLADMLNRPAGAVGLLLQKKVARPELFAIDRSGRRWHAEKLVAVMARDFAYQTYLDRTIAELEAAGAEWAQVAHPNGEHQQHGLVIHLPKIGLIRKSIFHPNSHARLVPHVPT